MSADYATLSASYDAFREPDVRLSRALAELVDEGSVVDVGAGTGKYARALADAGRRVIAIEPSEAMLASALPHARVTYRRGRAEELPLADGEVSAAMAVLASSHFGDLERALREMDRVSGAGTIIDVIVDPREAEPYWFSEYFPEVHARNCERSEPLPSRIARMERVLGRPLVSRPFLVADDFADRFTGAAWKRPRLHLDPGYRACSSSFSRVPREVVEGGVRALESDLANGRFASRHGWIEARTELDVGLRLVVARRRHP